MIKLKHLIFILVLMMFAAMPIVKVNAEESTSTIQTVISSNNVLDGVEVKEPTKIPGIIGLFLQDIKENISLALTTDPVQKAEKQLQFAAEKMKLAEFITNNSTDPKVQARAVKMTENAQKMIEKIEAKKDKILAKDGTVKDKLLENLAKQKATNEETLDKIEYKLPADKMQDMEQLRERMKVSDENFLDGIVNSGKVPEEVLAKIKAKREEVMQKRQAREEELKANKALIEKAKAGDKEAMQELKQKREEMMKRFQENKQGLLDKKQDLKNKLETKGGNIIQSGLNGMEKLRQMQIQEKARAENLNKQ